MMEITKNEVKLMSKDEIVEKSIKLLKDDGGYGFELYLMGVDPKGKMVVVEIDQWEQLHYSTLKVYENKNGQYIKEGKVKYYL